MPEGSAYLLRAYGDNEGIFFDNSSDTFQRYYKKGGEVIKRAESFDDLFHTFSF